MKKILLTTVSALALATSGQAGVKTGTSVTLTGGYAQNSLKANNEILDAAGAVQRKPKKTGGFNMGLQLGYTWAVQEKSFVTASLLGGYNFAKVKVFAEDDNYKVLYKPRFNFGLGVKGGYAVADNLSTYLGLNLLREQSQLEFVLQTGAAPRDKDSFTAYTLTPLIGLTGCITENTSWLVEAGYKFALKKSGLKKTSSGVDIPAIHKKIKGPRGFVANVGVTYHF